MRTLVSIILFILAGFAAGAQLSELDYKKDMCSYATDGTGAAKTLKMILPIPCGFTREDDEEDPGHIKSFYCKDRGCVIYVRLRARQLAAPLSKAKIEETFSAAGMRKMYEKAGTVSFANKTVIIDSVTGGLAKFSFDQASEGVTYHCHSLHYVFYYKQHLIYLQFKTIGTNGSNALALLDHYNQQLFRDMIAAKLRFGSN